MFSMFSNKDNQSTVSSSSTTAATRHDPEVKSGVGLSWADYEDDSKVATVIRDDGVEIRPSESVSVKIQPRVFHSSDVRSGVAYSSNQIKKKHPGKGASMMMPIEALITMMDDHDAKRESSLLKSTDNGKEVNPYIPGPEYPPSLKVLAAGMMSGFANKVFKFRMSRTASLVTSGAGGMALTTYVYPSLFDQYASLVNLFQEARLINCQISYALVQNMDVSTIIGGSFVTAFNPSAVNATAAPLVSTVTRLPNMKMFSTANQNWPIKLKARVQKNMPWCRIEATPAGADPMGGVRGFFCHVFMNTVSPSTTYFQYVMEAEYELRSLV